MNYCDETDVARYATPGETADLAGAVEAARMLVDAYCRDVFVPVEDTVIPLTTGRSGLAYFPATCQMVTEVVDRATGQTLPETAWFFYGGRNPRLRLLVGRNPNLLVAGSEPWAHPGGRVSNVELDVTCTLGWNTCPAAVREAAAMLAAAHLVETGQATATPAGTPLSTPAGVSSITVEGYSVNYADPTAVGAPGGPPGTGYPQVDRMLAPYRRNPRARWS